jgi:hypothetical protein
MLKSQRLGDLILEGYACAALCAELASQEADAQERDDLLAMAQGWLHLAQSYECAAAICKASRRDIARQAERLIAIMQQCTDPEFRDQIDTIAKRWAERAATWRADEANARRHGVRNDFARARMQKPRHRGRG